METPRDCLEMPTHQTINVGFMSLLGKFVGKYRALMAVLISGLLSGSQMGCNFRGNDISTLKKLCDRNHNGIIDKEDCVSDLNGDKVINSKDFEEFVRDFRKLDLGEGEVIGGGCFSGGSFNLLLKYPTGMSSFERWIYEREDRKAGREPRNFATSYRLSLLINKDGSIFSHNGDVKFIKIERYIDDSKVITEADIGGGQKVTQIVEEK